MIGLGKADDQWGGIPEDGTARLQAVGGANLGDGLFIHDGEALYSGDTVFGGVIENTGETNILLQKYGQRGGGDVLQLLPGEVAAIEYAEVIAFGEAERGAGVYVLACTCSCGGGPLTEVDTGGASCIAA